MVALAALAVFGAISMLVYALMNRAAPVTERRLATLNSDQPRRQAAPDEEQGPSRGQAMATWLGQFMPSSLLDRMGRFLEAANIRTAPENVLLGWIGLAVFLPAFYLLTALRAGSLSTQQELFGFGIF